MSWRPSAEERELDRETRKLVYVAPSDIHGKGLFARLRIRRGTHIGRYIGPMAKRNGSHVLWIEADDGDWIGRRGFNRLRYLNHDAKPNAEFDGFDLYALRLILADEEITIDYQWD